MAATSLPLELQQQIFSFLDARSFASARIVCKWWRYSATESVTLAQQLRKLPIVPSVHVADSTPLELQRLFNEAACKMALGVRAQETRTAERRGGASQSGLLTTASRMGLTEGARAVVTPSGHRTVTLRDRVLTLYDTSGRAPVVMAQRVINDLQEAVGSGPWLRVNYNHYELALSSSGTLLAIAQERTVQIYDLEGEPDSFTVNHCVGNNSGPCISGVEFGQNDFTLRVGLKAKGSVLYLGAPQSLPVHNGAVSKAASIDHWKGRHGLRHTFLESSLLRGDNSAHICGLQLLRPFNDGYLFAAQSHGLGEPRHYVFGHVQLMNSSHSVPSGNSAIDHESVTIFARLEAASSISRLFPMRPRFSQQYPCAAANTAESRLRYFDKVPTAHEHHPRFTLSASNTDLHHKQDEHDIFLILAEIDKRQAVQRLPLTMTHTFVYRLPRVRTWQGILNRKRDLTKEAQAQPAGHDNDSTSSLFNEANPRDDYDEDDDEELPKPHSAPHLPDSTANKSTQTRKYTVPRLPLYVGSLSGRAGSLKISRASNFGSSLEHHRHDDQHLLHVTTADANYSWLLTEPA